MKTSSYLIILLALLTAGSVQAQQFQLPKYQKTVLKNGLTIYLMEQHEVPTISVSAVMPAGAMYDGQQQGLASLTAAALKHGTTQTTKQQLDEAVDFVGASISTFSGKESAGLRATFATKDVNEILPLVRDVLVNPSFDKTEFEKEKKRKLAGLEQARESPRRVIGNYFDMLYYGQHPYANPSAGLAGTVANIGVDDVQRFYQQHYLPNGSAIAVVGDFNTADMKARLTKLFAGWKKGSLPAVELKAVPRPTRANVLLVNKPDATETTFFIGGPGIQFSNTDKVSIDVINTFFGSRFTSWLNDELRVNSGLTYGARSTFIPQKQAGTFYISTFTATPTTEAAIDKALEVLKKLHNTGADAETLLSAKNYVKGQFPPDFETSGQMANLLTDMFWFGFDEAYINNFEKNVDGLTLPAAQQIIKQYFPANNLQFVLIGKADEIRKIAEKYGTVKEVDIKQETIKL